MYKVNYRYSVLALSLLTLGLSTGVSANTDLNAEVEQLRAELKELKALIQQQNQNIEMQSRVAQPSSVPAQSVTQAPAVSLKTASGSEFKLYGNVRADASYQAEGGGPSHPYNQINAVPLKGEGENSDRFKSTLSATRLGFDFTTTVGEQAVGGKVEADFLGGPNLNNLRIRHAYLTTGNWLVGQTWSNFAVPDYMPETVDALAYVGATVTRKPQVRYQYNLQPTSKLFVAVEDPETSGQRLPALTARLNQNFADNAGVLGLRAMVHEKRVNNEDELAWGVGLGLKYDFTPQTSLKADYYHVKGDSNFVARSNAGTIAVDGSGSLAQSEFDSISVGLTQQFNSQWRGTLGYGLMKFDLDKDYAKSTAVNKELWQAWGNVFYSPTKPISLGLEYVYGEREAFVAAPNGSKTGEDNRVNAVAIYNF